MPEHDRPTPLTGIGPLVLGEVEQGSLDTYARLDAAPVVTSDLADRAPEQDAKTLDAAPETSPSPKESRDGT